MWKKNFINGYSFSYINNCLIKILYYGNKK